MIPFTEGKRGSRPGHEAGGDLYHVHLVAQLKHDLLDLPLPKHSFLFMKKDVNDTERPITCVSVSSYLKRNTDSVRKAVENDLMSVAPSTDLIFELGEM